MQRGGARRRRDADHADDANGHLRAFLRTSGILGRDDNGCKRSRYRNAFASEQQPTMCKANDVKQQPSRRHCEERSDEAIQGGSLVRLDCFASLAMTTRASNYSIT
jgi:hypothetical protein